MLRDLPGGAAVPLGRLRLGHRPSTMRTQHWTWYRDWQVRAVKMARTHDQQRCPGCGRWAIWVERAPARK